jgi:hypothetical protein
MIWRSLIILGVVVTWAEAADLVIGWRGMAAWLNGAKAYHQPTDKDPLDVVLRRTGALLDHLEQTAGGAVAGRGFRQRLDALRGHEAADEAGRSGRTQRSDP